MGFHIADAPALSAADAVQRADLIVQQVLDFLRRVVHGAPAEALQVLVGRVGAHLYAVLERQADGLAHDARVAGMEAARHVGAINERHDLGVQTHGPVAKAFADVAVQ